MLTQEQVAETRKANLDLFFDLSNRAVEGVEKLAALNLQVIRAMLAGTFDLAQKSWSAKEPQDWLALRDSLAAPMADKVQSYSRQVFDIVSATQAEFARIGKSQCEAYGHQMQKVAEDISGNAPAGSEATMTALNSAIAAANTLYETLQSSGQQAVEATRSNLDIAAAASKSARRAIDPASQSAKRKWPGRGTAPRRQSGCICRISLQSRLHHVKVMMNASEAAMAMGSAVLLFAAIFVAGYYRREHRRAQMLRLMAFPGRPWRLRHN